MKIVVFEDNQFPNFFPLIDTKSICQLKLGTMSLFQRVCKYYNSEEYNVSVIVRKGLNEILTDDYDFSIITSFDDNESYLFINSALIVEKQLHFKENEIYQKNGTISHFFAKGSQLNGIDVDDFYKKNIVDLLQGFEIVEVENRLLNKYWDLIKYNPEFISRDYNEFYKDQNYFSQFDNIDKLHIGNNCTIASNTHFDTTSGPIIIEDNVIIAPFSWIKGPVYIGSKTEIKPHTQICGGTSIHYNCRIGGEVNNAIFHSFSNKGHHGFVGHSYVGEWVNFGAGTTNSNLKNNYGYINVYMDGKTSEKTDMQYLGAAIGDFAKFSINCSINSGSIFGFSSNIFSSGELLPKYTGSFLWGKDVKFNIDKALECAKIMMSRRGETLSESLEKRFKEIYENC